MSLGIVFKGPEGIVLATDGRVTLNAEIPNPQTPNQPLLVLATFDNVTKLLRVVGRDYVGVVTDAWPSIILTRVISMTAGPANAIHKPSAGSMNEPAPV